MIYSSVCQCQCQYSARDINTKILQSSLPTSWTSRQPGVFDDCQHEESQEAGAGDGGSPLPGDDQQHPQGRQGGGTETLH